MLSLSVSPWLLGHLARQRDEVLVRSAPIAIGQTVLARLPGEWALRFVTIVAESGSRLLVRLDPATPVPPGARYLDIPRRAVEQLFAIPE